MNTISVLNKGGLSVSITVGNRFKQYDVYLQNRITEVDVTVRTLSIKLAFSVQSKSHTVSPTHGWSVMRAAAGLMDAEHVVPVPMLSDMVKRIAAPVTIFLDTAKSQVDAAGNTAESMQLQPNIRHKTTANLQVGLVRSPQAESDIPLSTTIQAEERAVDAANVGLEKIHIIPKMLISVDGKCPIDMDPSFTTSSTFQGIDALVRMAVTAEPDRSNLTTDMVPIDADRGNALWVDTSQSGGSRMEAAAEKLPRQTILAEKKTHTTSGAATVTLPSQEVSAVKSIGITTGCSLDIGWLPPVWVDGGLWIRQVHDDPIQQDNGALEVT